MAKKKQFPKQNESVTFRNMKTGKSVTTNQWKTKTRGKTKFAVSRDSDGTSLWKIIGRK